MVYRNTAIGIDDYDHDGKKDILLAGNIEHARIKIGKIDASYGVFLKGDGKGGFNEATGSPFAGGDNPFSIAIGDVNADGKPDLTVINSPSSMAECFLYQSLPGRHYTISLSSKPSIHCKMVERW